MLAEQDLTVLDENMLHTARAQRADLRAAMLALEDALARPAPGRVGEWSANVHDALVDLAGTFERHIAVTEGERGFLSEIVDHSPRLINAVQQLEQEHDLIRSDLSGILDHIRRLERHSDDGTISSLRGRITALMAELSRHRQHGADLVYEAHAVDIGGSD